jgi:hypothetical protein
MFALATPDKLDPAVMRKLQHLAAALDPEPKLFHCVDGTQRFHPERVVGSGDRH